MHILIEPSFFLLNKTGGLPKGEETRYGASSYGLQLWKLFRFEIPPVELRKDLGQVIGKHLENPGRIGFDLSVSFRSCPHPSWRIFVLKRDLASLGHVTLGLLKHDIKTGKRDSSRLSIKIDALWVIYEAKSVMDICTGVPGAIFPSFLHSTALNPSYSAIASTMCLLVALVAPLSARAIMVKMALVALGQRSPIWLPFACPHVVGSGDILPVEGLLLVSMDGFWKEYSLPLLSDCPFSIRYLSTFSVSLATNLVHIKVKLLESFCMDREESLPSVPDAYDQSLEVLVNSVCAYESEVSCAYNDPMGLKPLMSRLCLILSNEPKPPER
ncbi:hypothetical protein Tco_1427346 [Tanacetum coccineum]